LAQSNGLGVPLAFAQRWRHLMVSAAMLLHTVVALVLIPFSLCATTTHRSSFTNCTKALFEDASEHQKNPIATHCCRTPLDLRSMFPQLSHSVTATIVSRITLVGPKYDPDDQPATVTLLGSMQRCDCTKAEDTFLTVQVGFWKVPFRYTKAAFKEDECVETFHEPVILIAKIPPSTHFGHQMLTVIPALAAVKMYMEQEGTDITKLPVVFVDQTGKCKCISCGPSQTCKNARLLHRPTVRDVAKRQQRVACAWVF
jgi:hypothetical protein